MCASRCAWLTRVSPGNPRSQGSHAEYNLARVDGPEDESPDLGSRTLQPSLLGLPVWPTATFVRRRVRGVQVSSGRVALARGMTGAPLQYL